MAPTPLLCLEPQVCSLPFPPLLSSLPIPCVIVMLLLTRFPNPTETKSIADIAPSILKQLNQEQLAKLLAQQNPSGAAGHIPGLVDDE